MLGALGQSSSIVGHDMELYFTHNQHCALFPNCQSVFYLESADGTHLPLSRVALCIYVHLGIAMGRISLIGSSVT